MADQGLYLEVQRREPQVGWNENVGTLPEIKVTFNIAVAPAVMSDRGLNQYVILVRMDTKESIPVTYTSWDPVHKVLIFTPSEALVADELYEITLRKEFPSSEGRHMLGDITWAFHIDAAPIGRVTQVSPADATAYNVSPNLIWNGVAGPTGNIYYEVQLHDNWQFGPPVTWTSTVTASGSGGTFTTSIGTALDGRKAYYWRVRAYTTALTGDWSDTRSFYLGTAAQASPDATLQFEPEDAFELLELLPENGTPHQLTWPVIRATFSRAVSGSSVNANTVQLWAQAADGRVTVPTYQVDGVTLTVTDNMIEVVPPSTPAQNTRYTLRITTDVLSVSGDVLSQEITTYFTGKYLPLYGGTIAVRSELGGFVDVMGDDEIMFYLWRGSLKVNELMLTKVRRLRRYVTFNEIVTYVSPFGETWGMVRYAELDAALSIFEHFYAIRAQESSRHTAISTFDYAVDAQSLVDIRKRIHELRLKRDEVGATFLFAAVVPRTVIKGSYWRSDGRFALDWSYQPRRRF